MADNQLTRSGTRCISCCFGEMMVMSSTEASMVLLINSLVGVWWKASYTRTKRAGDTPP